MDVNVSPRIILSLPHEILVYVLSFTGTPQELCIVSQVCRGLAEVSRDDLLWRSLGHPSWEKTHALGESGMWKKSYMTWLRAALKQYNRNNTLPVLQNTTSTAFDYTVKVLLSGYGGSGKSSFLLRYEDDSFQETYISSIGVDFKHVIENRIRVQTWDVAGGERFRSITSAYYRGCHGLVIIYDVTNRHSFEQVDQYIAQRNQFALNTPTTILVGCKIDLDKQRVVTTEEGVLKAREHGLLFAECSSKTGEGIREAMLQLLQGLSGWPCQVAGMSSPAYIPPRSDADACIPPKKVGKKVGTESSEGKKNCLLQ